MNKEIVSHIITLLEQGQPFVLATIVRALGSTPREVGTSMIILPDGRLVGTIGGGCAEADVRQRGLDVIRTKLPELYHLDLTADVAEDEGMVCGGIMDVFLEPMGG